MISCFNNNDIWAVFKLLKFSWKYFSFEKESDIIVIPDIYDRH